MDLTWQERMLLRMRRTGVSSIALAEQLNVTPASVSLTLSMHRNPPDAEATFNEALEEVLRRRGWSD